MKNKSSSLELDSWRTLFSENEEDAIRDYFKFLSFQSISADPAYKSQVNACANWLVDYLSEMKFNVQLWPTTGHPTIFASNLNAGSNKPTLLIYNHYDVQPVDPIELWASPPFEPTIRNGEVYARGAQDNKGQCFYTIQALKMMLKRDKQFPINIKLIIEGEEESGSTGLPKILPEKRKELKSDYLAIVDVGIHDKHTPSVTLGMRGIVTMDVEVQGSNTDLHSGSHGGMAYNPLHALVELLSSVRDSKGKITIPGFYDDVAPVNKSELSKLSLGFNEQHYIETFGAKPTGGDRAFTPQERVWLRPSFEINGLCGGYSGVGFKTVIPALAHAKVSCRLVPNQDPHKIGHLVANYLKAHAPEGISVKVDVHEGGGKAVRAHASSPVVQAFARSFTEVFGSPCQFIFEGGSIPIVTELAETSGSEMVLVGLGLPDDQIHAPNEHFGLDRFAQGVVIMARAIELLA